jgi:hypothetical protein
LFIIVWASGLLIFEITSLLILLGGVVILGIENRCQRKLAPLNCLAKNAEKGAMVSIS